MDVEEVKRKSHLWKWLQQLDLMGEPRRSGTFRVAYVANCMKRTYISRHAFDAELRVLLGNKLIQVWDEEKQGGRRTHKVTMMKLTTPPLSWDQREKVEYKGILMEKEIVDAIRVGSHRSRYPDSP